MATFFSGVIFDMDGLLLDTERLQMELGPEVLAEFGHDLPRDYFNNLVGVARLQAARMIEDQVGVPIDAAALDIAWDLAMDKKMADKVPLLPGVHDFLDALDRLEIPRAVATNSTTARAEWKLDHAGLLGRLNAVVGVDQVAHGKPEPDVYLEAAKRLNLHPSQCVALDDSDLGVQSAMAAGVMMVIQIPDLVASIDRKAHHEVDGLSAAQTILKIGQSS
ncbi:HAD family hydrolase (plasmid) [Paracoccus marcusii]|uniref:HAD family hydrolase n=1 Tax=Paracoccus TaxID=265 RepID=UPI001890CBD5|nr:MULTISPECIES: HAD family phosphatase [Paracoccus]MBF5080040.1 HAD family phosphatase [Paracoccus sp. NBH48]QXI65825.1 Fructose-1-phosphate phosphatase YqaB [Paracoccus marcusii]